MSSERALLSEDPSRRPGAAGVVMELRVAGSPAPIDFSGPSLDVERADTGHTGRHAGVVAASGSAGPERAGQAAQLGLPVGASVPEGSAQRSVLRGEDLDRELRSRAVTTRRPDAAPAPRHQRSGGRERGWVTRTAVIAGALLLVAGAVTGGLWWAGHGQVAGASAAATGTAPGTLAATGTAPGTPVVTSPETGTPGAPATTPPGTAAGVPTVPATIPLGTVAGVVTGPAGTPTATESVDWAMVIQQLDHARAKAFSKLDPALLDAVYTADSPALVIDRRLITDLQAKGYRVSGAQHELASAVPEPAGSGIKLVVTDSLPSYVITDGSGRAVGRTDARGPSQRIMLLDTTIVGFRISSIEEL